MGKMKITQRTYGVYMTPQSEPITVTQPWRFECSCGQDVYMAAKMTIRIADITPGGNITYTVEWQLRDVDQKYIDMHDEATKDDVYFEQQNGKEFE